MKVFKIRPSSPLLSLPAVIPIYGRDELIQEIVDKILQSEVKKHVALKGGPGMGKTTTAIGIIHHPHIAQHFGNARHWVSCREASDIADDLKSQKLLEYISDSLDLDLAGSGDHRKNIKYFLSHHNVPRIIVLDNFETMWEPSTAQEAIEDVLAFLASFPQCTILLTTRNTHYPAAHLGVQWHQFDSIQPLSLGASEMLFRSRCPSKKIDNRLHDLLRAVDCIPLPIVLMASYGQENLTTSQILEIWNRRLSQQVETRPYKHGGDPMNKLDLSITMSLEGPLMKSSPEAPVLLRAVAGLPGAIIHENLRGIVPWVHDVDRVAAALIQTSLMTKSPDVWQLHPTIRSYMLRHYSLDPSYQDNVRAFYFRLIHEAGHDPGAQDFIERARRLSQEEINAKAVLLDTLEHNFSTTSVATSTDYSNYLFWNIPNIGIAKKTVELIRNQYTPATNFLLPLPLLRLGKLYLRLDNYPKAIEALEEAVHWYEKLGQWNGAARGQVHIADIHRMRNEHTRAIQLYSLAYKRFKHTEDARGMSACLRGIGIVYFQDDRYSDAMKTITEAQMTCSSDDHICIADSEREMGRVYRLRNPTESIRHSARARRHYLIHGPRRDAPVALYQTSIALYLRGDYGEAEDGLNEAHEEFRSFRNDAQMGYSIFHLAEMNRLRGSLRQALHLYNRSANMFEHMGDKPELVGNDTGRPRLIGNKFMVAICLNSQAELYARLCQPDKAKQAYNRAYALLGKQERTPMDWRFDIRDTHKLCDSSIRRSATFGSFILFFVFVMINLWFMFYNRRRNPMSNYIRVSKRRLSAWFH